MGRINKGLGLTFLSGRVSGNIRLLLRIAILVMSGILVVVFIRYRLASNTVDRPIPPEDAKASLVINRFHHTATRNGKTEWILDAKSAKLYSDTNTAVLADISVVFYLKGKSELKLSADSGRMDIKTLDMTLNGHIVANYPGYTLRTETLHYLHESNIISTDSPVHITGRSITLSGDTARFDMKTGEVILKGDVKGSFGERIKL